MFDQQENNKINPDQEGPVSLWPDNVHVQLSAEERQARVNRGGHAQLFFESAIAIPQLEGSSSATF
jgi:hypothetical protein